MTIDKALKNKISLKSDASIYNRKNSAKDVNQLSINARMGKKNLVFALIGVFGLIGGVACVLFGLFGVKEVVEDVSFPQLNNNGSNKEAIYSALTGVTLSDASLKMAPAYCIQTPNGTDGARPQAGLNEAGVIFEAIAEAGITRFAAIYQNPSSAVIGPIRSLRIYYLEWDTPFDCTIVHAGGAADALEAVAAGGYKDLSENYTYMYRGTYGSRLWNNLFTTSAYLRQFSADYGYESSDIKGFARMTPAESKKSRINALVAEKLNIIRATNVNTSELGAKVSNIALNFGGWANSNVRYNYDLGSNTYYRSYESGNPHEVYSCDAVDLGEKNPEDVCSLVQMNPAVVVAMVVQEGKASDNYHEDITTIGTGDVYIFQNGVVIKGTWNKGSKEEQIKFFGEDGKEVALAPGQTFITAVPAYGGIEY